MKLSTYAQAIKFLYDLQLFGAVFGLENTRRLAALAGNPQEQLRFIHLAGTNGKGSVCAMLESVYRAAGLKTGLYTSPHLVHFGERIQVNGERLSEPEVIRLVERMEGLLADGAQRGWWDAVGRIEAPTVGAAQTGHPTFFEVVTVMALLHFAEAGCEVVLWEAGLGGRLDATNIVTPLASVITNVSVEHAAVLGDTTAKIAAEKSGIIKPGVPVVTGARDGDALRVISEVAASRSAILRVVGDAPRSGDRATGVSHFHGYQRVNTETALAVVAELQPVLPVPPAAIETGLRTFHWPGRLQEVRHGATTFLIDGAHNPGGMRMLRESLQSGVNWKPVPVICGTFADKDVDAVFRELLPLASRVLLVPITSPRSASPLDLCEKVRQARPDLEGEAFTSLAAAVAAVADEARVLVTGSLFLVGSALELLGEAAPKTDERGLNDWTHDTSARQALRT